MAAWSHVTGDHKGRPYGKRGRRGMMLEGEGGSRTVPTERLVERLNVTSGHEGRPYGKRGWSND